MVFPAGSATRSSAARRLVRCLVCFRKMGGRGGRTRTLACWNQNPVPLPTWRLPYAGQLRGREAFQPTKKLSQVAHRLPVLRAHDSNRKPSPSMDAHPCCCIPARSSRLGPMRYSAIAAKAQTPRCPSRSFDLASLARTASASTARYPGKDAGQQLADRCARFAECSADRVVIRCLRRLQQSLGL
jgi:hypothetical protein